MKESLRQQAGHRPGPSTGSRQAAQSCGSATSAASRNIDRMAAPSRANRLARTSAASISPSMCPRYRRRRRTSTARSVLRKAMAHPVVFDRRLLRARRARAAALGPSTFLLQRVAEDLADRLATVLRRFEVAVDLGTPTDAVSRALAASGKVGTVVRVVEEAGDRAGAVVADEEVLPFGDGALDLVVSALALQFVNDLPGTLIQIRRALRPDGLLLAALCGGDTLSELRQAFAIAEAEIEEGISPRIAPFA